MTPTRHNPHSDASALATRRRRVAAFTVIELLIVMAVVIVLVAVLLVGGASWRNHARIAQTKTMIDALDAIVDEYRVETGRYPDNFAGSTLSDFFTRVEGVGDIPKMVGSLKDSGGNDAWGQPIVVNTGDAATRTTFESYGPDEAPGGGDDIVSGGQP